MMMMTMTMTCRVPEDFEGGGRDVDDGTSCAGTALGLGRSTK